MVTFIVIAEVLNWVVLSVAVSLLCLMGRAHMTLVRHVHVLEGNMASAQKQEIVGSPAPAFRLSTLDRSQIVSSENYQGHPTLLVFLSPTCHPCHIILPHLSEVSTMWQEKGGKLYGISSGDPDEMSRVITPHNLSFPILHEEQWEVTRKYHVPGTPWGIAINAQGIVSGKGVIKQKEHIISLMETALDHTTTLVASVG